MARVLRSLAALAVLGAVAGCAPGRGGVDLTLRFDETVPDEVLARLTTLSITTSGDETAIYTLPLGRAAQRTERFVYRPLVTTRTITISVSALEVDPDAMTAEVAATGLSEAISVARDHEVEAEILLGGPGGPDAGVTDDAAVPDDLAGADTSEPPPDLKPGGDGGGVIGPSPSKCSTSTAKLCEPFEVTLNPAWTKHQTNGSLTIDTSRAYRGASSLHLKTSAVAAGTTADVRLSETTTLSPLPADFYVRGFYYIPSAPVNGVQLFSSVQNVSPYLGVQLLDSGSGYLAQGDSVSGGAYEKSTMGKPPTDRWFCLEWHVHVAGDTTGLLQVWLDDSEVMDLHNVEPTDPPNHLSVLSVGFQFFSPGSANPASEAWLDEVVIDTARVGCAN